MKQKLTSIALASLTLLTGVAAQAQTSKVYIVQMKEEPAASYQGTTAGYAATQAAPGSAFQSHSRSIFFAAMVTQTTANTMPSTTMAATTHGHL